MTASAYPITANGALYDPAQVEAYIATLFQHVEWQPGQGLSLLGIGEKGTDREGIFRERQFIAPGFIGAAHGHLKRWAMWHAAGFIVPAVLHAAAAQKGDVTLDKVAALTAIVLDIDSGDVRAKAAYVTERLGRPTMIVASGGIVDGQRKVHAYWLLNEPSEEIERVAALRKQLAAKVGGDQSFGRATQVIRVPGSVHAKNGKATVCQILERTDNDYSLDDLADIIEGMQPMPGCEPVAAALPLLSSGGLMDFAPSQNTAVAALGRDIAAGGDELTRFSEFSKVAGLKISEVRAGRLTIDAARTAVQGWVIEHMVDRWSDAAIELEFSGLLKRDIENHGPLPQPTVAVQAVALAQEPVQFRPHVADFPIAATIPPRPWLLGRWLQRGIVTGVVSPGGTGKSSLISGLALSMASGKEFLGKTIYGGPLRVLNWNLEDSGMNMARTRVATAIHHGITEQDCGGRLFVASGPDGQGLCTAVETRDGLTIIEPNFGALRALADELELDAIFIDPFVSSHQVNENDNNHIDAVIKRWAKLALATEKPCSITLVHHSTKMHGERVTAESSRGASAFANATRGMLVLNRMSESQAENWGIDPISAQRHFTVQDDKHNHSAPEAADWFKLESQSLNNATETHEADSVGVVTRWQPPRAMDGVDATHLHQLQVKLDTDARTDKFHWRDIQTKDDWAGDIVGELLKLDTTPKTPSRTKVDRILDAWIKSGALKIEQRPFERPNKSRTHKPAVLTGRRVGEAPATMMNFAPKSEITTNTNRQEHDNG